MQSCLSKGSPVKPNAPADSVNDQQNAPPVLYCEAIGSLIYVMTMTRPDIAFSVSQASQFFENPGKGHWNGVKMILAYLTGTSHFGLLFDGNKQEKLISYFDSDYAILIIVVSSCSVAAESPSQACYSVVCPCALRKLSLLLLVSQQKKQSGYARRYLKFFA